MTSFLRYLISLAAHLTWHRMGRRGPVPPMRLPGGRHMPLIPIGPWQLLVAAWVLNKLWERQGAQVRGRVFGAVRKAGSRAAKWIDPSTLGTPSAAALGRQPGRRPGPGAA